MGFVLLAIILAFASRPLIDGISGSNTIQSRTDAAGKASDAVNIISADVEMAFAPDRDRRRIRDIEKLRRALVESGFVAVSDDPADNGRNLDVRDITVAAPNSLSFRADVYAADQNAPVECVSYEAEPAASAQYKLERVVYADTSCSGSVLSRTTLLEYTPRIESRVPEEVFAYDVLAPDCTTQSRSTVSGMDLNRIVAVRVNVAAVSRRRESISVSSKSVSITPTSRDTIDYRRALGCG